ncbi:hypothetical protein [Bacillus multifaciens]|uniref:hypothetical protein n=1 Tax=Bacillus multifaciens TaxID=3068506 RepID=UPI0027428887|nr:hypothetical protein [Bacillus sp. WLY-B-L8]MDP7978960.1 hypothetical protein [Bacillus sp. WLY-B-L8]
MKKFFKKLYDNIEVSLLVCLSISFVLGIYNMLMKAGGPTTVDYIAQAVLAVVIIVDIWFLRHQEETN